MAPWGPPANFLNTFEVPRRDDKLDGTLVRYLLAPPPRPLLLHRLIRVALLSALATIDSLFLSPDSPPLIRMKRSGSYSSASSLGSVSSFVGVESCHVGNTIVDDGYAGVVDLLVRRN